MASHREPLWDNARWIAITLVVVGHAIEVPSHNDLAFGAYLVIYAFHMPLFAFISGRFSRAEPTTASSGADLVRRLVAPLLIFQLLYMLVVAHYAGYFTYDLARPVWHLWFIPALIAWRLTLPLFAAVRWPVLASVVLACAAGLSPSSEALGWVSRTFAFLPFFVAGWAWHRDGVIERALRATDRWAARAAAAFFIAGCVVVAVLAADWSRAHNLRKLVQGEHTYQTMGYPQDWAFLLRLAALLAGVVLLGCVLVLTSRRERVTTAWGARTMTVFLIHLFPILVAEREGWITSARDSTEVVLLLAAAAVVWSMVLSTRVVDVLTAPLVHPRLPWLLRVPSGEAARRMVGD
ncbi:MAG: acyltransferase family protein [Marmoricola sp.]